MSETKPLYLYDRSRVVQDWKCPRSRFWNYEFEGRGVVPNSTSIELHMGIIVHDALCAIATFTKQEKEVDIDTIATLANKQMYDALYVPELPAEARDFATEQGCLVEGMIRGFFKLRWPQLLDQYPKILFIEGEMTLEHDGLSFMSKPDIVMGNDFETVYVEYKTTSTKKDTWINSWATAVQLHSTVRAVEKTHGITIDAVIIQGLYKGYESYGKQSSPFCYCYKRNGHPPFTQDEYVYEYKAGLKRFPIWEIEGGIKKWIDEMPEVILADQFPQTAPIFIKDYLVDAFFRQRADREHEIKSAMQILKTAEQLGDMEHSTKILDSAFPQRFDQCTPSFGRPCPYVRLCHGPIIHPLDAGFTYRQPHHEAEEKQIGVEE